MSISNLNRLFPKFQKYGDKEFIAKSSGQQPVGSDWLVYVYEFTRVRGGEHWDSAGVYHGAQIPYMFDAHVAWLSTNDDDRDLTGAIQDYWLKFAQKGSVNVRGQATWKQWKVGKPNVMALDMRSGIKSAADSFLCDLM